MTLKNFLKSFNTSSYEQVFVRFTHLTDYFDYWTLEEVIEDYIKEDEKIVELLDHTDFEVELEVDIFRDFGDAEVTVYLNVTIHNL